MRHTRTLCVVTALLCAGCSADSARNEPQQRSLDNLRLTEEVQRLQHDVQVMSQQLEGAEAELQRARQASSTLDHRIDELLERRLPPSIRAEDHRLVLEDELAFHKGRHQLSAEGRRAVGQLAGLLREDAFSAYEIVVEGHSDPSPVRNPANVARYGDNWGLSAMRAAAVIGELQKHAIDGDRLRGSFRAQYDPRNPQRAADNRRVEIYLIPSTGMVRAPHGRRSR